MKFVADNITIRYKVSGKIHRIEAGTPFDEGVLPPDLLWSLKKDGSLRFVEQPKQEEKLPSLMRKFVDRPVRKPDTSEKVFNLNPEDIKDLSMQDLRQKYSEICVKYNKPEAKFTKKDDIIAALSADIPSLLVAPAGEPDEDKDPEGDDPEDKDPEGDDPEGDDQGGDADNEDDSSEGITL